MMRRVYVVRHGNTFAPGEPPRRVGGRTDLPLVASGRDQAAALGRHFRELGITFDRCLTGPLIRTRNTAAILLDALGTPVLTETAEWLREIDHGPDEDKSEAAVLARIGRAALDAWEERAEPAPGWQVDVAARRAAWSAFLHHQAAQPGGNTLVVTSNGAARFALPNPLPRLRTGAWGELAVGDGVPRALAWDLRP